MRIALPFIKREHTGKPPGLALDCVLAAKIVGGDRDALARLLERHTGGLYRYLLHRLGEGHEELIERVITATLTDALRHIGPYARGTTSTPMELWLIRLAERNLTRKHKATASPAPIPQSSVLSPQPSDLARLRQALANVPNRHRFILSLALFEQASATQLAQALGTTPARAMRRLRDTLKRIGAELDRQEEGS